MRNGGSTRSLAEICGCSNSARNLLRLLIFNTRCFSSSFDRRYLLSSAIVSSVYFLLVSSKGLDKASAVSSVKKPFSLYSSKIFWSLSNR